MLARYVTTRQYLFGNSIGMCVRFAGKAILILFAHFRHESEIDWNGASARSVIHEFCRCVIVMQYST